MIAAAIAFASSAGAQPTPLAPASGPSGNAKIPPLPPIVLESHLGERSPQAVGALEPVLDELELRGCAAHVQTIEKTLAGRMPMPGIRDAGKTIADIAKQIEIGLAYLDKAQFKEAEPSLRRAVSLIKRNPALVVLDTTNEKIIFNAFVGLALAQLKLNQNDEATETITELQRMSTTPIDRGEYGPLMERFYRTVQKQNQASGRGSLKIAVSEANAMIFLDNRYRGLGKVFLGDVMPGPHSVLVQLPGTEGRQYTMDARVNETSVLDINWPIDSTLHVSDQWVGFSLATEQELDREATYANDLVRRWNGQSVIVVGPTRLHGTAVILGFVYPAKGEPSGAFVPISSNERRLRDLARFLIDGTVTDGVSVLPRTHSITSISALSEPVDEPSATAGKAVTGASALAIAAGGVVYARRPYNFRKPAVDDGRDPEVYVMLAGSVALGGGAYLWLRESRTTSWLTAGTLSAGATAIAAGTVLYFVNQDPGPNDPAQIRATKTGGLVVGGAGLALAATGLWLLHGEKNAPAAAAAESSVIRRKRWFVPTVAVDTSGALVGVAGGF